MITQEQLTKIIPNAKLRAALFIEPLNEAMDEFSINTPLRQAAFLAQIGHESGQLLYTVEIASGEAYEGRKDLGNTQVGDGKRYKGRGLIQITGRANYTALMLALNIDCLEHPEVVEEPVNACRSASWWWRTHNLSVYADVGTTDSMVKITRIINGGVAGLADRLALYATAKNVLIGNG